MTNLIKHYVQQSGELYVVGKGMIVDSEEQHESMFELLQEESAKAFERGRAEGERKGYEKAKEESLALVQMLETIIGKILEQKKRLFEHLKPDIVELSMAIAERIIRIELAQGDKLVRLIESFLTLSGPSFQGELVKVILSPEDLVMIEGHLTRLSYDKKEIKSVRFLADPLIHRGDCRIETKTALLNFTIARELDDLRSKVLRQ